MNNSRHSLAQWWTLVKRSFSAWIDDYAPSMGAALSYYSVFSMAPLLLLVISVAGLVFGEEAARGELFSTLAGLMGADAAKSIEEMLAAMAKPSHGVTATLVSVGVLVIGATTVFGELQDALDRIWRAPDRPKSGGLWGLLRSRLLSFGMILGIAFLLMISLVMTAAVSALGKWWGGYFGDWELLLQAVNLLVGFLITAAGFALIYKFMPRVRVQWRDVLWGAAITALLFTIGKFLIGLYIGKTGVASGFGAAGSIAVVFVWVYYSAQIFLLGAEFTWAYAQMFGSLEQATPQAEAPAAPTRSGDTPTSAEATAHVPPLDRDPAPRAGAEPAAAATADAPVDKAALAKLGVSMAAAIAIERYLPRLIAKLSVWRAQKAIRKRLTAERDRLKARARGRQSRRLPLGGS